MNKNHPLFLHLHNKLFHSTSVAAYRKIKEDGFIKPNIGNFPYSHSQSRGSCASRLGVISLFDFKVPIRKIFISSPPAWYNVLLAHEPVTIIIELNRKYISEKLISWYRMKDSAGNTPCLLIPYVEVGYPEPIPLSAVEEYIVVLSENPKEFGIENGKLLSGKLLDKLEEMSKIYWDIISGA